MLSVLAVGMKVRSDPVGLAPWKTRLVRSVCRERPHRSQGGQTTTNPKGNPPTNCQIFNADFLNIYKQVENTFELTNTLKRGC